MKIMVVIMPTKIVSWGLKPKLKWFNPMPRKQVKILRTINEVEKLILIQRESTILQRKKESSGAVER